ncbi:MAG: peptidase M20, partial [Thermomicrobiales bacterium]
MTTAAWSAHLDGHRDEHFQELLELLRIPSISTDPAHAADVAAAADWVARRLRAAGVPEVDIVQTSG